MSGLSRLRYKADRESPNAVKNHLFVNPRSRRPISAAEVSIPGANTTDSKAYHPLDMNRPRLLSNDDANVASLEAQISSLNAKIATLEPMNAKLKDENQKFELTTSQLKGDNDKLKFKIEKIKFEENKLKEDNDKLKAENSSLKGDNDYLDKDNDKIVDENCELTREKNKLKGENTKLKAENSKLKGENNKLKDKNDSLESQLSCHDNLIRSLKDEINEKGAMLNSSRNYANEVVMGLLASGYDLPNGLPDHLIATYENAMELSKSITKELGPSKLSKHDAGPGSSMSPTLSGKSTDNGNGCVRKGPLLDEPVAKRLKRVHDSQCVSQSAGDDILRAKDSEMDDETSLRSFSSDTADDDHEEV